MNRTLQEEVEASLADGYLPCAVALKIARKFEVAPKEVGDVANKLGIRIINCQLGCFKFEKADPDDLDSIPVSSALAAELKSSLVAGKLPCGVAFDVARKVKPQANWRCHQQIKHEDRWLPVGLFPVTL